MKKVAAVAMLVAFMGSYASAGDVFFEPLGPTEIFNDPADGPTQTSFEITIGNPDQIQNLSASVFDLSVAGGPTLNFVFSDTGPCPATNPFCGRDGLDTDTVEINVFALVPSTFPSTIGTLTIDATGVDKTDYSVVASGNAEDSSLTREAVSGMASFTVVPEPATISLLALGAVGLIRRRK